MATRTGKAAVCRELNKPVVVETISVEGPKRGEVTVKIAACGVCHSDLSATNGTIALPPPLVLGHEGAGEVVEVGEGVTGLAVGDHVVTSFIYMCGKCRFCAGGRPVLLETRIEEDFKLGPERLRGALTDRTRMLLLCSPSNPTGVVYTEAELAALADVAIEADLAVVADEIYDQLVFDDRRSVTFPALRPGLADRTVVVGGVSKTYSMTGWRIGWTICPEPLAKAIGNLQSQETSNPCSVSQHAALAAVTGPQDCVGSMLDAFQARRDLVAARLRRMPGVRIPDIGGAFYAFFDIREPLAKARSGGIATSMQWCEALLEREHVALVAGSAFGAEGHVRMSFAAAEAKLNAGLDGIERFLAG